MPNILVCNDDGIFAPGLLALALAMAEIGNVWVIAPENNQSIAGHKKTMDRPLRAKPVLNIFPEHIPAYAIDGAPSDCAALGLQGFLDEKIDFVASGINTAGNMGQDLTYSGTVSIAFEAVLMGVPGIAFSLADRVPHADYGVAAQIAKQIVIETMQRPLPPYTILNVNIPHLPMEDIKGIQITKQGVRHYFDKVHKRLDPFEQPYYWIGGDAPTGDISLEGTDLWAVNQGYVSITPVDLDLTRHDFLKELGTWNFSIPKA